jgi:aryl-alcohol dehydrogenase-like predicted oxidoreductase
MGALHEVVQSGKVRYIGASSMYAWEFARLQYTAKLNGWTQFISMQPFYNLLYREEEREMIPFCKETGVGVIPWSPIARGTLTRARDKNADSGKQQQSEREKADARAKQWFADAQPEIIDAVEELAAARGTSMAVVAIAWVLQKGCWPILGLNSEKRVIEALDALKFKFTPQELDSLETWYRPRQVQGM